MTRISTPTIRTGVTAATAAPRAPVQPAAGTPDSPLPLSPAGVAALLRLAVVSVDSDGHVSHWNRGAEELFGHRWEAVFGQSAAGLLSAPAAVPAGPDAPAPDGCPPGGPPRDVFALLDGHTRPAWAGTFPVAGRDGTPRETLWWSYRIADDAGPGLLLLAADAGRLRSGGLRITIGDRMLPYAPDAPGPAGLRVLPCLGPTPDQPGHHDALPDPAALAGRLGAVLPQVSRARLERLLKEVTRLGFPAVSVEGSAPLPVLPFEAVRPYDETPAATTRTTGRSPVFSVPLPDGRGPAALLPPPRDSSGTDEPAGVLEVAAEPDRDEEFPPASPGHLVQQQLALLRETGTRVGTTLDLGTTAAELCRVAVPRFADFASVLIVDDAFSETAGTDPEYALHLGGPEGGPCEPAAFTGAPLTVRRIAIANRHPGGVWDRALEEGELFTLAAGPSHGLTEPFLLPVVDASVADDLAADLGVPALGPLLPGRSVLLVPLTARGTLLGRMCFVREPQRLPFTAKDSATAVELAARGAVHLDNARLHRFESRAAATLQRSMLPTSPAAHPRGADRPPLPAGQPAGAGRRRLVRRDPAAGRPGRADRRRRDGARPAERRRDGPVPHRRADHGRARPAPRPAAAPPGQPRPPARLRPPRHLRLRRLRPDPPHPDPGQRRPHPTRARPPRRASANCCRSRRARRSGWAGCRSRPWRCGSRTAAGSCCAPTGWSRSAARA